MVIVMNENTLMMRLAGILTEGEDKPPRSDVPVETGAVDIPPVADTAGAVTAAISAVAAELGINSEIAGKLIQGVEQKLALSGDVPPADVPPEGEVVPAEGELPPEEMKMDGEPAGKPAAATDKADDTFSAIEKKISAIRDLLPYLSREDQERMSATADELTRSLGDLSVSTTGTAAEPAPAEPPAETPPAEMKMDAPATPAAPAAPVVPSDVPADVPAVDVAVPPADAAPAPAAPAADEYKQQMRMYLQTVPVDVSEMSLADVAGMDESGMKMKMDSMSDDEYKSNDDLKLACKMHMKKMFMADAGLDNAGFDAQFQKDPAGVDAKARALFMADEAANVEAVKDSLVAAI